MKENDEKNFNFEDNSASNESSSRPAGAVDLYFQPVEDGDDERNYHQCLHISDVETYFLSCPSNNSCGYDADDAHADDAHAHVEVEVDDDDDDDESYHIHFCGYVVQWKIYNIFLHGCVLFSKVTCC